MNTICSAPKVGSASFVWYECVCVCAALLSYLFCICVVRCKNLSVPWRNNEQEHRLISESSVALECMRHSLFVCVCDRPISLNRQQSKWHLYFPSFVSSKDLADTIKTNATERAIARVYFFQKSLRHGFETEVQIRRQRIYMKLLVQFSFENVSSEWQVSVHQHVYECSTILCG